MRISFVPVLAILLSQYALCGDSEPFYRLFTYLAPFRYLVDVATYVHGNSGGVVEDGYHFAFHGQQSGPLWVKKATAGQ